MDTITINLDGLPIEIKRLTIPLAQLILDIANPRIQYLLDTRLNDDVTQDKIKFVLAEGNDQYEKLKEHIERNGGIYDPNWVVPQDDFYIVIEGNTRAFIYEELSEKYVNDQKWNAIDSYVLPYKVDRNVINFIRLEKHLFDLTPWDACEKARELYRLYNEEDYSLQRLGHLTKLTVSDIKLLSLLPPDQKDEFLKIVNKNRFDSVIHSKFSKVNDLLLHYKKLDRN